MTILRYSLAGCPITLHINHRAKKNIILRPRDESSLHMSIPAWLSLHQLQQWLATHEPLLQQTLAKAACTPKVAGDTLPEWIWLHGQRTSLIVRDTQTHIVHCQSSLHLPSAHIAPLQQWLWQQAQQCLLPKLALHAQQKQKQPAQYQLTHAKTFWGICRQRTGIRLNWRLIGAPESVQDYVCLHELAHLTHANHSAKFWQLVSQYCPEYEIAEQWLKQHGKELFLLG